MIDQVVHVGAIFFLPVFPIDDFIASDNVDEGTALNQHQIVKVVFLGGMLTVITPNQHTCENTIHYAAHHICSITLTRL